MNDPANPRARASVLSILFFGLMNNVLKLGKKKSLGDQDLFPLLEDQKAELLVSRAESDGPELDTNVAFISVTLLGAMSVVPALATQQYDHLTELWGLKLKVALIGIVYKKRFELFTSSLNTLFRFDLPTLKLKASLAHLLYTYLTMYLRTCKVNIVIIDLQGIMATNAFHRRDFFTNQSLCIIQLMINVERISKFIPVVILIDSCRKEMSILRLKAVIVTILIFLLPHHTPNGLLTSVITLAFTGKQLSPFAVFTLLLGLTLIRETFCYNLSMSVQSVADAKEALDRLQIFLEIRGSRRKKSNRSFTYQVATKKRIQSGVVNFVNYKKLNNFPVENALINTSLPIIESNFYVVSEVPEDSNVYGIASGSAEGHRENVSSLKQADVFMAEVSCSWSQDHLSNTLKSVTLKFTSGDILTTTGEVGGGKSTLLFAILGELPLSGLCSSNTLGILWDHEREYFVWASI
ncbi:unnamed protein product [Pocillopora meandrina]|uniref:ABC transporter domain-containing protein n=1 Tax=Pocillopora meandrina TaxID=46732 RepID=A0AAU9VJP8_9CNID|nr:unnamed protein product [Pocillopora meandrina]